MVLYKIGYCSKVSPTHFFSFAFIKIIFFAYFFTFIRNKKEDFYSKHFKFFFIITEFEEGVHDSFNVSIIQNKKTDNIQ